MKTLAVPGFSLRDTLECGQFFGWSREGDGYLVRHRARRFRCRQEGGLLLYQGVDEAFVRRFFSLDHDIRGIARAIGGDPNIDEALVRFGGLRIIRQDPWECVVSFITSACSNIPRITRNLADLAKHNGGRLPRPEELPGEATLRRLGFGFRAKYLALAAKRFDPGVAGLATEALREELMTLPGVAEKVADCILLYGYGRLEAFPVDTWIRKTMTRLYFRGRRRPDRRIRDFAARRFGPYAGYAQQLLFIHAREVGVWRDAPRDTRPALRMA